MDTEHKLSLMKAHFRAGGLSLAELSAALRSDRKPPVTDVAHDLDWIAASRKRFLLAETDDDYPSLLHEIPDPPPLLLGEGDRKLLSCYKVAIVGSRRATPAGLAIAESLACDLASAGICIVSGLANGIDGAAHRGALSVGGATIAVLGTGPDITYPAHHHALRDRIRSDGLILSEYPVGMRAFPSNFPRRNRIVTGLSLATIVVEAAVRSGSLTSARFAMEQGRDVFAVPGSIRSAHSRGCHQLIRDGACLLESVDDVYTEIEALARFQSEQAASADVPDPRYALVLERIASEPVPVDDLVDALSLPADQLLSLLTMMEIEGLVTLDAGLVHHR